MPNVDLPHGTVNYAAAGPVGSSAPPVVFVHGLLVDGALWAGVAERLAAEGVRSYAPDLPLGAHRIPLKGAADRSPLGVAWQVLDFIEALGLDDVTLVGNDTGGAICQLLIDADPSRIGRLVLTNCDAFDQFPPFPLTILFRIAKHPVLTRLLAGQARARFIRHSPLGFGPLSTNLDADQTRAWIEPARSDRAIRHDLARFVMQVDPKDLAEVAERLHRFDRPVCLVWGMADRFFTPELGRRLEDAFADASFEEIPGARAFVSLDAPDRVADAILATVGATGAA